MADKKTDTAPEGKRQSRISNSVRKYIRRLKAEGRRDEALALWKQERARRDK